MSLTDHGGVKVSGDLGKQSARIIPMMLLASALGCNGLLDVDIPGRVPATALDNPAIASTLVTGAMADFECAWSEHVLATSLFTDEFITASSIISVTMTDARIDAYRTQGAVGCTTSRNRRATAPYRPLQVARVQSEDVYSRLSSEAWAAVPNREENLARMAANAGYMHTLLGEAYCENSVAIDGGPLVSKASLWNDAERWFTTAIGHAAAAGRKDIERMATLGRARARLNQGNGAGALADARTIPMDFVFHVTRDTNVPSRENQINQQNVFNPHHSVGPRFRNLTVDGVPDPRVPVVDGRRLGEDGFTQMFVQSKYTALETPFPLATWREALLIIAEVEGGQVAVNAINTLRDRWKLPHFSSGNQAEILAQVIEERRRELFAEGHRINDLQRHKLEWPEGLTHRGLPFGQWKCFPLMFSESQNNPNI